MIPMLALMGVAFDRTSGALSLKAAAIGFAPTRWTVAVGASSYPARPYWPPPKDVAPRFAAAGEPQLLPVSLLVFPRENPLAAEGGVSLSAQAPEQSLSVAVAKADIVVERAVKGGVSAAAYLTWSRRLTLRGWFVAWRKLTRLAVFVEGRPVGDAALDVPRGDVAPDFPWLAGEHAGWEISAALPADIGAPVRVELLAYAGDELLFSRRRDLDPARDYALADPEPIWARALRPLAVWALPRLPEPALRAAFASPRLGRLWSAKGPWADLRVRAAQALARGTDKAPLRIALRTGDVVLCDPFKDQVVGRSFLLEGVYEAALLRLIEVALRPGDAVVDVGACYGHVALAASRAVGPAGRVVAVEPNPSMHPFLEANFAGRATIDLARVAAADRAATLVLTVDDVNFGASSLTPPGEAEVDAIPVLSLGEGDWGRQALAPERSRREVTVEAAPLDALLAARGIAHPALVKIDVEGAEGQVLDGAAGLLAAAPRPLWVVEHSRLIGAEGAADAVFARFLAAGYRAFRFDLAPGLRLTALAAARDAPAHCNLIFAPPERLDRLEIGAPAA